MAIKKILLKTSLLVLAGVASSTLTACKTEVPQVQESHVFEDDTEEPIHVFERDEETGEIVVTVPEGDGDDNETDEPSDPSSSDSIGEDPETMGIEEQPMEDPIVETTDTPKFSVTPKDLVRYSTAKLNVRTEPSAEADKIGTVPNGTKLKVTGKVDGKNWYQIELDGETGFVSGKYLAKDAPKTEVADNTASSNTTSSKNESSSGKSSATSSSTGSSSSGSSGSSSNSGSSTTSGGKNTGTTSSATKKDEPKKETGSNPSTEKEDTKKETADGEHSDAYNAYMSGKTPINKLDFSDLKNYEEYAAIESNALTNGDFLPKSSSGYDASTFKFDSDGSYRSGFVQTNPNAGSSSDPGKGTKYEGTSFTGNTYIDSTGRKHYKSGKGGELDPAYNNPTQVLKDGTTFADYLDLGDYDQTRDIYPSLIADFLSRVCTDSGLYQETPDDFWD